MYIWEHIRDLKIPCFRCTGTGMAPCLTIFGNDINSLPGNQAIYQHSTHVYLWEAEVTL